MDFFLDIETGPCDGEALELELSLVKPAANIKDEAKKASNVESKRAAVVEKAALQESSPILCIGVEAFNSVVCFTSFDVPDAELLLGANITVMQSKSERDMIEAFMLFMESSFDEESKIVTFNGEAFDMRKIFMRSAFHGISIPEFMFDRRSHTDLMLRYTRYFSMSRVPFISIGEVLSRLGICNGKMMDGSRFYDMVKSGETTKAVLYNALDCLFNKAIAAKIGV
jgi:hypothetical protein